MTERQLKYNFFCSSFTGKKKGRFWKEELKHKKTMEEKRQKRQVGGASYHPEHAHWKLIEQTRH